jgi:carbonic anhydrase
MRKRTVQIFTFSWLITLASSCFATEPTSAEPNDALKRLLDGNARFVAGKSNVPLGSDLIARRAVLTKEQKPFAVVLSCSDSRVPPELIFDVGLGGIFVVWSGSLGCARFNAKTTYSEIRGSTAITM